MKKKMMLSLAIVFDLVDYLGGFIPFLGDAIDVVYVLISLAFIDRRKILASGIPIILYIVIELVLGIVTLGLADFFPSALMGYFLRYKYLDKEEGVL